MISVNKRIEPLNSRTKDWRGTLSEDDRVEVQVGCYLYMVKGRKRCSSENGLGIVILREIEIEIDVVTILHTLS